MEPLSQEGKDFILDLYDQLGAYLIPIEHGTKHPPLTMGWTQYFNKRAAREEVLQWIDEYDAFALMCGKEQGFYTVDFDIPKNAEDQEHLDPKAQGLYDYLLNEYPTWAQKSGSKCGARRHLIYATDKTKPIISIQNLENYPGVEIRGEKSLILIAYSRHPDGGYYELLRNPIEDGFDTLPYEFFEDKVEYGNKLREKTYKERKHTEPLLKVQEPGRHRFLIQEAGHYCRTTRRWKEVIVALNQAHCDPPLPPHELDSIFASGSKYSKDIDFKTEDNEEVIPEKLFTTFEELKNKEVPPVKFLVDGKIKILENAPCVIFGPTAQCKSFILAALIAPWSEGKHPFDTPEITTVKSKILLVSTEHSESLDKDRLYHLGSLTTPNAARYDRADRFEIENEKEVALLLNTLVKYSFDVVIFDVQTDIFSGDDSTARDASKLRKFFRKILALGKTPIGVAHSRKGQGVGPLIESIRGSGDYGNKAACAISVKKKDTHTVIIECGKSRGSEELPPVELKMLVEDGHVTGFKFMGLAETFQEAFEHQVEDLIKDYLAEGKQPLQAILNLVKNMKGGSKRNVNYILAKWKKDGFVKTVDKIGDDISDTDNIGTVIYYEYIQ